VFGFTLGILAGIRLLVNNCGIGASAPDSAHYTVRLWFCSL